MLPLRFFRSRPFTGTAIVSFAQSIAIYPLLLFLAIYLQEGLGFSPTEAGLRLLPMTLSIFRGRTFRRKTHLAGDNQASARFGPRPAGGQPDADLRG